MMLEVFTSISGHPLQEATFSSLIRTIFWIVVIGYALRFIAKLSVVYAVNKTHEELRKQSFNAQPHQSHSHKKKQMTPDAEDVDFIEIKD
jgi:ABC-type lipoprotein release transport system permease subunit